MMVQDFVHRSMRYLSTAFRQYLRTTNRLPKNARGMIDEISESLPAHFPESLCSYLLPDPSYPEQFPSNLDCRIHGTLPLWSISRASTSASMESGSNTCLKRNMIKKSIPLKIFKRAFPAFSWSLLHKEAQGEKHQTKRTDFGGFAFLWCLWNQAMDLGMFGLMVMEHVAAYHASCIGNLAWALPWTPALTACRFLRQISSWSGWREQIVANTNLPTYILF